MSTLRQIPQDTVLDQQTRVRHAPLRLLFAHNDYGRPSGEEDAINGAAAVLTEEGHHVTWLRESSAPLINSGSAKASAFVSGIYSRTSRRRIVEILTRESIDLLHVQNLFPLLSPSILGPARGRGIPIVMRCPNYRLLCPSGLHLSRGEVCQRCVGGKEWWCVVRNCEQNYLKSLGYAIRNASARITSSITDNVTLFVVLSEFQRQRFIEGGIPARQIAILHNFVDQSIPETGIPLGNTVSFLGRPAQEKGIETFLEAARALKDLPFAVAGDPRSLPDSVGDIPPNVKFHGFLSGKALDAFCRNSRMILAPSTWYEGFPNILVRAMQYEKPVICSRIGALSEIVVEGETGLLHEPNNASQLIDRIQELYQDPQRCRDLGAQGRRRAETCYSREAFYEQLMRIYNQAMLLCGHSWCHE